MTHLLRTGLLGMLALTATAALTVSFIQTATAAPASESSAASRKGDLLVLASQHPLVGTQFPAEAKDHAGVIDILAPMWFGIADDGSIEPLENCDGPYASYVSQAKALDIKVMPILRNFKPKALLGDPAAIAKAVEASLALAERESFEGLVLDIEHLDAAARQPLVDLTAALHAGLQKQGKQLVVAVAARAWKKEYDYAALAAHSDYLYVMTYDYVGTWSKRIGPTAPWSWQQETRDIQRDLKIIRDLGVPSEKLLFGVALYGPDFTLDKNATDKHAGVDVQPTNRLVDLARKHDQTLTFDPSLMSSWFEYTAADGSRHRVWYDDKPAFAGKIEKVRMLDMAGIGVWSIRYAHKAVGGDLWQVLESSAKKAE